jgi:hypothetical protein
MRHTSNDKPRSIYPDVKHTSSSLSSTLRSRSGGVLMRGIMDPTSLYDYTRSSGTYLEESSSSLTVVMR